MDVLLTSLLIAGLGTFATLGIVVLPWASADLEGSAQACKALGEGVAQVGRGEWARGGAPAVQGAYARS